MIDLELSHKHIPKNIFWSNQLTKSIREGNTNLIYGEIQCKDIHDILSKIKKEWNIERFVDVGSGCGKLVIYLSMNHPEIHFTGIEIEAGRYENAMKLLEKYNCHENVEFLCNAFEQYYFGNYDFIYCCNTVFTTELNEILYHKILREVKQGFVVLFDYNTLLSPHLVETFIVETSWSKRVQIFLFRIDG